jgi:hypothetical protein
MMAEGRKARMNVAVWVILFIVLFSGCASYGPTTQQTVTTTYLLEQAGFKKLPVYQDYTRSRAALMNNIPVGKITTFETNGSTHYVYNDEKFNALYIGDELAYQKYLSLAQGQNVCQLVKGPSGEQFWACMQEYEQRQKQGLE